MSVSWIKMTDRMPNPDEHSRVLVYTEGVDFNGEQFFDVETNHLNECYFERESDQPAVCAAATHWKPLAGPLDETTDNHVLTVLDEAIRMGHKFVVCSFNPQKEKQFIKVRDYMINVDGVIKKECIHKSDTFAEVLVRMASKRTEFVRWLDEDWRKIEI